MDRPIMSLRVRLGITPGEHNESALLSAADAKSNLSEVSVGPEADIYSDQLGDALAKPRIRQPERRLPRA
jgi:hypothetical protein